MDYSFIKLHSTLAEATSVGDFKNTQISYYTSIQLSPTESYLQKTNNPNGISFNGDYTVETIRFCETVIDDITNNVFMNEYVDEDGLNQCDIEYVNLNVDYFGRAVIIRFTNNISGEKWYTNPIKITNKEIEETIRLDYTNATNLEGFSYESSSVYQSIRLDVQYDKPEDESEVGEYYQISTKNTISTRLLENTAHLFKSEGVNLQTYHALKKVFAHSTIYADFERVTNNPTLSNDDRKGRTNLIPVSTKFYINEDDVYTYEFQIFDGLVLESTYVEDDAYYTPATVSADLTMTFNIDIELLTGTLEVINTLTSTTVVTYTESDMAVVDNVLTIEDVFGTGNDVTANGIYHINISSGLLQSEGTEVQYPGIDDITTWNFTFLDGQYEGTDYNNSDYLTD